MRLAFNVVDILLSIWYIVWFLTKENLDQFIDSDYSCGEGSDFEYGIKNAFYRYWHPKLVVMVAIRGIASLVYIAWRLLG